MAGTYDQHPLFAYSTVAVAPSPATTGGSLDVASSGDGALFAPGASGGVNAVVWPAGARPLVSNAEIVRITGRSGATLTLDTSGGRNKEGTSSRTIVVGDQIAIAITPKALTDIQSFLDDHDAAHKHGGSDEIATATAGANAIPKADGSGKLDSWISAASDTVAGIGLLGRPAGLTGATQPTRFVGATATGAPSSGTFAAGDFVIAQNGAVWVCTVAGSPGTWVQANGSRADEQVALDFKPSGLTGATANTRYVGATTSGPPSSGTFAVGDFVVSNDGLLWVCVTAGSPGSWRSSRSAQQLLTVGIGYLEEAFPVGQVQGSTALTAGTIVLALLPVRGGRTYTNLVLGTASLGTAGTGDFVGLYDTSGNRLVAQSADVTSTLQGGTVTDKKVCPLGATYTPTVDGVVYGALVCVGGTPPTLFRSGTTVGAAIPLSGSPRSFAIGGTGQTGLPTTVTLAAPTQAAFWMALT
jgi:hypothetical protein